MKKLAINPAVISILIVLLIWSLFTYGLGVSKVFIPKPHDTFIQLLKGVQTKEFWLDVFTSWWRVLLAFLLSFLVAYPLMISSMLNEKLKKGIFVIIEFFRYLPIPVFIPLTILWFGIGDVSKIVIVFLGTFAQMIPMFYDSSIRMKGKYNAFEASLKLSKWEYVKKVVIPGSFPSIIDDSRICFGWAWTYLIIAELLGAENGIGYAIVRAQRYLATDKIFAFIIVIGLIGIIMDRLFAYCKKRFFKWA